jgi:N-acetyl-anhydromuramyl-L-alanine amidase AmpD
MNKANKIIVHHSGGSDANPLQDSSNFTVQACNELHKKFGMKSSLGWWAGYHFYIDKNGIVTQTRAYTDEGAHTKGQNNQSVGICLAGNFDATLPTPAQVKTLTSLLIKITSDLKISPNEIYPHRKFANKTCYGNKLSDTWARDLIKQGLFPITKATIGDNSPNIERIQEILTKGGYVIKSFQKGVYDENMACNVLYFQLKNNVADIKELSSLRGEIIGNKTVNKLNL